MEPTAPVTRKRKRAHSTKCPCCSEDRGKPEKETRRRRREDSDLQSSGPVVENKRSSNLKTTRVCKKGGSKLNQADKHDSENGDREEGRANEGRVLRSGRSTPVSSEIEKDKVKVVSQLKKSCKGIKKRLFVAQKGSKHTKLTNNVAKKHPENSMLEQNLVKFTPAAKKFCDNQDRGNMQIVSTKVKMSRRQNQSGKSKSFMLQTDEEDSLFSRLNQSSNQVENGTEKIKRDIPGKSNIKPFRKKPLHLPPGSKQSVVKKTLAIEKLKIRAFDDLKEKLEIALSQSPLTVPECVEWLKKITSTNLRDILESKAPVMEERATSELKTSEDFEMTDSESETSSLEKEMVENMNESEAAEALVSFKVQTTVVNTTSSSSQNHSLISSSFQEQSNSKKQAVNMQYQESITSPTTLQNLNIMVTSRAGLPSLSSSNQPVKKTEIPTSTSVVIPPVLPSVSIVQAPVTFQLLHVPSQVTKPSLSGDLTSAHLQQTPGFLYQNPTTVVNKLTPTSVSQQPNSIFPPALNNFLYLAKLKSQCEQKSLLDSNSPGLLPGIQTQEHILPSSSFPPACHLTAGTSLVNSTVTTLSSVSTSTTEVQSSTKLRPILPREPLVSKNLPLFGQGVKPSTGSNTLPKIADQSSIVKKAVKRLVNERTKTNDSVRPEVSTSLQDIATSFRKSTFTPYKRSESHEREGHLGSKLEQQDVTEMTSKEQAIKALLSIGGNESISQQGNGEHLGVSSKTQETNKTSGLKVVFETDKGIFKVDDVTIDPQVNTIGKESYTCGKCGKIFTSLSYLARHIKRVCPDMSHRKWKCNHCDKAFRHPFGLQQHVYTHTGERPHKCPLCPKAFYSSNDLRRHSRIHSGERPYKCNHCGKSFATTISLKTHTFIHTGEKPHRCPHCTKTFATSSKLGRHIVTHSEQRPFSCVHCPKTFNRSGDLRRHNLHVHDGKVTGIADNSRDGQHEEKIYRCMECDGSFNTPRELEIHINEHTI